MRGAHDVSDAVADQVMAFAKKLTDCEAAIRIEEDRVNALAFDLYGMSKAERELVTGSIS